MTQEEKDLLFKDLCARLPYRVVVETQLVNTPGAKYPVLKVLKSYMLCDFMQTVENVIHNPILIYKLSKLKHINIIELTDGYLEEIKDVFSKI